ncbi:YjbQ family protein [Psychrobacter sp. SCQQ22]|nr:YjbQ family protein [Psychrobacter sp. SCQQ22]
MLFGVSLTIPLINGTLGLGSWQGIYLCEHRDHLEKHGEQRNLVITVNI